MSQFKALLFGLGLLTAMPSAAMAQGNQELTISTVGNELRFDKPVLHAHANQPVTLTFHNGADPGTAMNHTWVLVMPGTEDKVASAAIEAGESKNYVPEQDPDVLAATPLVKPGQSVTITFRAPHRPGDYPYLCTFPAHSRILRGVLKVD